MTLESPGLKQFLSLVGMRQLMVEDTWVYLGFYTRQLGLLLNQIGL